MATAKKALAQPLMSASDPFYAFKDQIQGLLNDVDTAVMKWKSLLESVNTTEDTSFVQMTAEVQGKIASADKALGTFESTVTTIERQRSKFPHIDDSELQSRKEVVAELRAQLGTARGQMNTRAVTGKLDADRRMSLASKSSERGGGSIVPQSRIAAANDAFVGDQQQRQQVIIKQQDEHLDGISASLTRLGVVAVAIQDELGDQEHLIDDIERKTEDAKGGLDGVVKNIGKFLKTKSKCQTYTIIFLIIVLIAISIAAIA